MSNGGYPVAYRRYSSGRRTGRGSQPLTNDPVLRRFLQPSPPSGPRVEIPRWVYKVGKSKLPNTALRIGKLLPLATAQHPLVRFLRFAEIAYAELVYGGGVTAPHSKYMPGFIHVQSCNPTGPWDQVGRNTRATPWTCLVGQANGNGMKALDAPYTLQEVQQGTAIWVRNQPLVNRWASAEIFQPAGATVDTYPGGAQSIVVVEAPAIHPMVQPWGLPIQTFTPPVIPLPYHLLPYRAPAPDLAVQTERGPIAVKSPKPEPALQVSPDGFTNIPPTHELAPPRARTRERKVTLNGGIGRFWWGRAVNFVTEAVDFIEAVYNALPEKLRQRLYRQKDGVGDLTPQEKLYYIFLYHDQIDMEQAVKNLAVNEIKDQIMGGISRRAVRHAIDTRSPHSLLWGPAI